MLNAIKNLINEKQALQESVATIMEDATGTSLDDLIVLGEEAEVNFEEFEEDAEDEDLGLEDGGEDDEMIEEENDEPASTPSISDNDDIMSSSIDEEPTLPGEDLPTPVGRQTGLSINDNINDIMKMEIDLASNTPSDILPVPPASAGDAVVSEEDDIMSQRIDSGFGEEADQSTEDTKEDTKDKDGEFSEAITLGDESTTDDGSAPDTKAAENGGSSEETEQDPGPGGDENAVTSAVRDKVSEADGEEDGISGSSSASKEELLKKLGNITKNLEDAKKAIMDTLQ